MKNKIVKLVEKKETEVTQESIEKKTAELVEMIQSFQGSKADAAEYVCFEVVVWASYNHYEALGILAETMARYRQASIEAIEEEENE